jgi:endonuclease VIII
MPEGPSIVILKEAAQAFAGQKITSVEGNTKLDMARMLGQRVTALRSWGKHFLIEFPDFALRVHFLLFGSYRINERKDSPARLRLGFECGELNFYTCSLKYIEGDLGETYDWTADVMSDQWNAAAARKKLRAMPSVPVCDALLDQDVFAGVGNIIKNEVLFRIRVHPLSQLGAMPGPKLTKLVEEARNYSFDFLQWKKAFVLRQHWLVHAQRSCPRGHGPLTKSYLGQTNRRSFFCDRCQKLYQSSPSTINEETHTMAPKSSDVLRNASSAPSHAAVDLADESVAGEEDPGASIDLTAVASDKTRPEGKNHDKTPQPERHGADRKAPSR